MSVGCQVVQLVPVSPLEDPLNCGQIVPYKRIEALTRVFFLPSRPNKELDS